MSKAVHLSIPNACHKSWQEMTPTEKGRFCMACSKTVTDFSNMSDQEILKHIAGASGGVCGRLNADQLDRVMVLRKESHLPWLKYFFQFTLPAFLVSLKAQSQTTNEKIEQVAWNFNSDTTVIPVEFDTTRLAIRGRVLETDGRPVYGATIMLKGTSHGVSADANGYFTIYCSDKKRVPLVISCIGYKTVEMMATPGKENNVVTVAVNMDMDMLGLVVVTHHKKRKEKKAVHHKVEKPEPVVTTDSLKLYPNPLVAGGNMNMELCVKDAGKYSIEINDLSGRVVMNEPAYVDTKQTRLTINTSQLLPGGYIVSVRDNHGKNIGVKKIIVQ